MRKIFATTFTVILLLTAMFCGADSLLVFVDLKALMIFGGVVGGGTLWSYKLDHLNQAFLVSFGTGSLEEKEAKETSGVFHRMANLSIGAGLLGGFIGLIQMMTNLDDPTRIGPGMAICLLSLLYAFLFGELWFRGIAVELLDRARPQANASVKTGDLDARKVGSALILCSFVGGAILMNGPLSDFFNLPSIAVVGGVILFGVFGSFSARDVFLAFSLPWGTDRLEQGEAMVSYHVFSRMSDLAVAGGVIGTFIGLVQMLQNLEDPSAIGPAMALALLTSFYGVFLSEAVFRTMASDCLARAELTGDVGQTRRNGRMLMAVTAPLFALLVFFVMLVAMATFV